MGLGLYIDAPPYSSSGASVLKSEAQAALTARTAAVPP